MLIPLIIVLLILYYILSGGQFQVGGEESPESPESAETGLIWDKTSELGEIGNKYSEITKKFFGDDEPEFKKHMTKAAEISDGDVRKAFDILASNDKNERHVNGFYYDLKTDMQNLGDKYLPTVKEKYNMSLPYLFSAYNKAKPHLTDAYAVARPKIAARVRNFGRYLITVSKEIETNKKKLNKASKDLNKGNKLTPNQHKNLRKIAKESKQMRAKINMLEQERPAMKDEIDSIKFKEDENNLILKDIEHKLANEPDIKDDFNSLNTKQIIKENCPVCPLYASSPVNILDISNHGFSSRKPE